MARSGGILAELRHEMWYFNRIRAGEIALIGDDQGRWYSGHGQYAAFILYSYNCMVQSHHNMTGYNKMHLPIICMLVSIFPSCSY